MKHLRPVSLERADAFGDFVSAKNRAWSDFLFAKKNGIA